MLFKLIANTNFYGIYSLLLRLQLLYLTFACGNITNALIMVKVCPHNFKLQQVFHAHTNTNHLHAFSFSNERETSFLKLIRSAKHLFRIHDFDVHM